MAEAKESKRSSIKKVDAAKMAEGIYSALFTSGATFEANVRDILPNFDQLPDMGKRVVAYGLKQKLDDSMAGAEDESEALEEVKSTWEAIVKGQWTLRVAGEGVEGGLFARAYAEWKGVSLSEAKAKIAELVQRNLEANQKKLVDAGKQEDADKLTERMIFNRIRDGLVEAKSDLKEIYESMKAKKKSKGAKKIETDLQLD